MSLNAKNRERLLLILPTLVWYVFFLVIPLGFIFLFSVLHKGAFGQIEYRFELTNYFRVIEPIYLKMVLRSLMLAFLTTLACLCLSFPLAYLMARSSKNWKNILLGLVVVPFWTNFVIRVFALKLTLGESGFLNRLLLNLGLIESPLILVNNITGTYIGMIYNYLPFMILPLYVNLERFDFLLVDAARDLGANQIQIFFKIVLPLCLSGIVTGSLFVFIPAFGEFVIPDLLGGSQSMYVGNLITETFLKSRDWPFGSALSALLVMFSFFAFFIQGKKEHY